MGLMAKSLTVGDQAPDFTLPDAQGKPVHLKNMLGEKNIVLFFFPKAFTPGCTAESCSFRDQYEVFKDKNAEVIGISADSPQKLAEFSKKHRLPYVLLSDADNTVRKQYGAQSLMGLLPGRATFVIDRQGIIRSVFNSHINMEAHIENAVKVLQEIQ